MPRRPRIGLTSKFSPSECYLQAKNTLIKELGLMEIESLDGKVIFEKFDEYVSPNLLGLVAVNYVNAQGEIFEDESEKVYVKSKELFRKALHNFMVELNAPLPEQKTLDSIVTILEHF